MASFLDALAPLVDAFDMRDVAYLGGGSLASIAHGVPRTTLDVDVIAEIEPHQVPSLVAQLQGMYDVQAIDIQEAIQHRSSFNLVHLASKDCRSMRPRLQVPRFASPGPEYTHREGSAVVPH